MVQFIDKEALVAEIERLKSIEKNRYAYITMEDAWIGARNFIVNSLISFLDTFEAKEVNLDAECERFAKECGYKSAATIDFQFAKHFFELGLQAQHNNWKVVDDTNLPQEDKTKIYCVFTKQRYILAKVISHPQDDDLLQWKCTEFPHHRYDMCEGDKYMQIV